MFQQTCFMLWYRKHKFHFEINCFHCERLELCAVTEWGLTWGCWRSLGKIDFFCRAGELWSVTFIACAVPGMPSHPDFYPDFSHCVRRILAGPGSARRQGLAVPHSWYAATPSGAQTGSKCSPKWLLYLVSDFIPLDCQENWDLSWVWDQHCHVDWKLTGAS